MNKLFAFFKNWTLPISMATGIISYFVFSALPLSQEVHRISNQAIGTIQPILIFSMLFISFCKVDPKKMKLCTWHLWIALIQAGSFILLSYVVTMSSNAWYIVFIESAMLCLICPTATAAVVVTDKLGGNIASITSYTIIINVVVSFVTSAFIPMMHPEAHLTFVSAFGLMIAKVFPLLVCPFILALLVRYCFPKFHALVLKVKDLAFYLWTVALALALVVTTRALVHSNVPFAVLVGIAGITMFCCLLQFYLGRKIGHAYNDRITAGQAFGQKNTVFIIWLAYTFMNPITAVAGGFYSIWHNLINSYQLYRRRTGKSL